MPRHILIPSQGTGLDVPPRIFEREPGRGGPVGPWPELLYSARSVISGSGVSVATPFGLKRGDIVVATFLSAQVGSNSVSGLGATWTNFLAQTNGSGAQVHWAVWVGVMGVDSTNTSCSFSYTNTGLAMLAAWRGFRFSPTAAARVISGSSTIAAASGATAAAHSRPELPYGIVVLCAGHRQSGSSPVPTSAGTTLRQLYNYNDGNVGCVMNWAHYRGQSITASCSGSGSKMAVGSLIIT